MKSPPPPTKIIQCTIFQKKFLWLPPDDPLVQWLPYKVFQPVIETCVAWQASHEIKVFCLPKARILFFFSEFFLDTSNKGLTIFLEVPLLQCICQHWDSTNKKWTFVHLAILTHLISVKKIKTKKNIRIENIKNRPQHSTLCCGSI